MLRKPLFTGVCTALVTPFLGNKVNYPLLMQLLQRQMDAGIRCVVLAGTTGEASTLSDEEKLEMFRRCKEYAGSNCTVIAGTGSNDTRHAIALSMAAEKMGADALLLVTPYYNKATPEGLVSHYIAIARSVSIPIILYNVPGRTGVDIPVSVYAQLSKIPNIVGVKEASTDIRKIIRIRSACGEDFAVWSGNDDLITPVIALGGKGVISVMSNVAPEKTKDLAESALDGDFDTAADLQTKLLPLTDLLFCEVNPIPVKEAMKHLGFDCGSCRLPLTSLTPENKMRMEAFFVD